jgi:hypothetical protein
VGTRAVLDAVVKRKIPRFGRESNPRTPIVHISYMYRDKNVDMDFILGPPGYEEFEFLSLCIQLYLEFLHIFLCVDAVFLVDALSI